jgi:uncharacterized phiE125 gp8 family phage protein
MILYSRVTTAPTSYAVTLDEVKDALKIDRDDNSEIGYLTSLILTATQMCEAYTGLSFIAQTRTVKLDYFKRDSITLPYGPVNSITSIAYVDEDDANQAVDDTWYSIDTQSGVSTVRIGDDFDWPDTNRSLNNVVITYTTGYEDASLVPEAAKQAILRRIAFMYQHRGDEKSGEDTVWMDLLDTVKVYWNAEY